VLTHGWAPGMRLAVDAADGVLLSWPSPGSTNRQPSRGTYGPSAPRCAQL
jgi:hypothetical protein